jgi:ribosomal protein L31
MGGTTGNPGVSLIRGKTYVFDVDAGSHPFYIKTVSGEASSSTNVYTSGITGAGTDSGTVTFVVPLDAPSSLYYQCQYHSAMTGTLNIADESGHVSVVNSGSSSFTIGGVTSNPTLELSRGSTYTFDVSAASHPFYIKSVSGEASSSTNLWTDGVTGAGATSGTVVFSIPSDAPNTLYYQCSAHSAMTGTLNIVGRVRL